MPCVKKDETPTQELDPTEPRPRLPLELIDIILEPLGHSSDRATRNTLITCSLVSNGFYTAARKHYFRKLVVKHFTDPDRPLPQREYHLIHVFFTNPGLLSLIKELDIIYDSTYRLDDQIPRYRDTDSPIDQDAILERFPWIGPPLELHDTLPLYLLLRQSPIHTARFILRAGQRSHWMTTNHNHLLPICSISSLRRVYFVSRTPLNHLGLDRSKVPTGLERLDLLWVAETEEELEQSAPPETGDHAIVSPASTNPPHFPVRQVIRMSGRNAVPSLWVRLLRFFEAWFPDYQPSPALVLQDKTSSRWVPTYLMGSAEVCDALDNMHNACPSVQRVSWQKVDIPGRFFFEITIERKGQ